MCPPFGIVAYSVLTRIIFSSISSAYAHCNTPGPPDLYDLYNTRREEFVRRRVGNEVCAKYSFSFDGIVSNISYMVTRAWFESVHNYGPITSGCYRQTVRGHQVEVCMCQDRALNKFPCNSGFILSLSTSLYILVFIIFCLLQK